MSLTQTRAQLRANVRKFADVNGTSSLVRHADADVNDYIDRAIGSVYRKLTEAIPDQRFLSSTTVTTSSGTATYALPADFDHLISADLTANGTKVWLTAYEMHERPILSDANTATSGVPISYRLRGSNIEYLPTPAGTYTSTLWYVPNIASLSADGSTWDTISRLDDYVIAYAARFIAVRDKSADLVSYCTQMIGELDGEIRALARSRDKNSPPRVVDERLANRYGRRK